LISRLKGTLLARGVRVEIETDGGVVYEVDVPLTVLERLPAEGEDIELRTVQVVSDSSVALYGFVEGYERKLFQRLLTASGVGAKLALAMMSTYAADRLIQALLDKDVAVLRQVPGVGRKTAEKLAIELSDKVADIGVPSLPRPAATDAVQGAVRALVSLGYSFADADRAVRVALEAGQPSSIEELIRRALAP
jgi:holliday junction DNA helicase RuvA